MNKLDENQKSPRISKEFQNWKKKVKGHKIQKISEKRHEMQMHVLHTKLANTRCSTKDQWNHHPHSFVKHCYSHRGLPLLRTKVTTAAFKPSGSFWHPGATVHDAHDSYASFPGPELQNAAQNGRKSQNNSTAGSACRVANLSLPCRTKRPQVSGFGWNCIRSEE